MLLKGVYRYMDTKENYGMGIFNVILTYLGQGSEGMMATVVKRTGSAPRDVGAKMFVGNDGKVFGTVGGGRLEADAYKKAIEIMGKGVTEVLSINMDATKVEDEDMLCGGNVDVLLEPVTQKQYDVYRSIGMCLEKREQAVLFTQFGPKEFAKTLIRSDGGVVGEQVEQKETDRCMKLLTQGESEFTGNTFAEPLKINIPLYIFGAGHVAQHLAKIAKIAGFHITVVDDRKEFANIERFQDADSIIVGSFPDTFYSLDFTGNEYIVICTRSHEYDLLVLEEVLKRSAKYVGMIGSSRKVAIIIDRLNKKGFDKGLTARVHAPIGIAIDAETPQEIAVSIVAELIKIKNAKKEV